MARSGYPLPKFHFQVDWGKDGEFGFTEVTGLDVEVEVIEYREGDDMSFTKKKQPGLKKYSDLTFKRGYYKSQNSFFEEWKSRSEAQIENGKDRRDIIITLLGDDHTTPLVRWKAERAWVKKIQSTDLKADGNEVAIETMEVCHEGLTTEFM